MHKLRFPAIAFSLLLIVALNSYDMLAQIPPDSTGKIDGSGFCMDGDNNYYVTGNFSGTVGFGRFILQSKGDDDVYIAKYNYKGIYRWAISVGGTGTDAATSIKEDGLGNVYVTGFFTGKANFQDLQLHESEGNAQFLVKLNYSGDIVWCKKLKGYVESMDVDRSGNIYTTGYFEDRIHKQKSRGGTDVFFSKYDTQGNLKWIKTMGGEGEDQGSVITVKRSSIYVSGMFTGTAKIGKISLKSNGQYDFFIAKYSDKGEFIWVKFGGGVGSDYVTGIEIDNDDNTIISIAFTDSMRLQNQVFIAPDMGSILIAKFNGAGELQWMKQPVHEDEITCVDVNSDNAGNIYITGNLFNGADFSAKVNVYSWDQYSGYLVKISPSGTFIWGTVFESAADNFMQDAFVDQNGDLSILGNFSSSIVFGKETLFDSKSSVCLAKYDDDGHPIMAIEIGHANPTFDVESLNNQTDVYGKILKGQDTLYPVVLQNIILKDSLGVVMDSSITDIYGDFSFKSIHKESQFFLTLPDLSKTVSNDKVFIANPYGELVSTLEKNENKEYSYKIGPANQEKFSLMKEEDTYAVYNALKRSKQKEIKIDIYIYYESGSWKINANAKDQLYRIVKILKKNPTVKLKISSHTDAVGDAQNNLILSRKRAAEISLYLIKQKIATSRIMPEGYGEQEVRNRCVNNVECSVREHKYNRRTEIKFIRP